MSQVNVHTSDGHPWRGADFLGRWLQRNQPSKEFHWILAISGGVDSMGLLVAFTELWKKKNPYLPNRLIVAHLDHGWREKSASEANKLKAFVENQGLLFVTRRLGADELMRGNLEAFARQARYSFFDEVAINYRAPIVFLAHQASDRRETLLKNVLEGKELAFLDGIKEKTQFGSLTLLRPWLSIEKEWIEQDLVRAGISWFEDETNRDVRFLRASMREKLFPVLDAHWPKAWRKGLDQIALYSEELSHDLDESVTLNSTTPTPVIGGWLWMLPELKNSYSSRYYLRLASSSVEPLDRNGAQRLAEAIENQKRVSFRSKSYLWQVNGPYLIALKVGFSIEEGCGWYEPFQSPKEGEITHWGPWQISCREKKKIQPKKLTLQDYWKGEFFTPCLAEGEWTHLQLIDDLSLRSKILRHMQRRHIPPTIRKWMPLASQNSEILLWRGSGLQDEPFILVWSWVVPNQP